jgi:hypothetical protein
MANKHSQQHNSKKEESEKNRKEIANVYAEIVNGGVLFPTRSDLLNLGVTRDRVRHYFGNIAKLREAAKLERPECFSGVLDIDHFTSGDYRLHLENVVDQFDKFVVVTAVNGQPLRRDFLLSINTYCKKNNAALLVIPCHDPAHNLDNEIEWHFDEIISNECNIVFDELKLNENIHISSIRVNAKQINPITGLGRFVQSKGSGIFGSPKQSLEYVPVSNIKFPHALMSTGAITSPNYKTTRGNSLRTAFIAEHDHVVGGVIVEIQDNKTYHFRQIQSDEKGGFADLGKFYCGRKVSSMKPKLVIGDYHAGEHDLIAEKAWIELVKHTKATEVILHDLHNGISTNHHDEDKIVLLARRSREGKLVLSRELEITGKVLNLWTNLVNRVTVTRSNHDEFLHRWVEKGKFVKEPHNFQLGCQLAEKMVDGVDPLIYGLELHGKLQKPEKINWLSRDEDYQIAGIECGAHGDLGGNGSRGSKANLERSYGKAVIAHSHTPGILRGVFQVGTTSLRKLDYNRGPSSWIHCSCLVYENGQRQLINSIDGLWHL